MGKAPKLKVRLGISGYGALVDLEVSIRIRLEGVGREEVETTLEDRREAATRASLDAGHEVLLLESALKDQPCLLQPNFLLNIDIRLQLAHKSIRVAFVGKHDRVLTRHLVFRY